MTGRRRLIVAWHAKLIGPSANSRRQSSVITPGERRCPGPYPLPCPSYVSTIMSSVTGRENGALITAIIRRTRKRELPPGNAPGTGSPRLVLDLCLAGQSRRHYLAADNSPTESEQCDDDDACTRREKWVIIVLSVCPWHWSLESRYSSPSSNHNELVDPSHAVNLHRSSEVTVSAFSDRTFEKPVSIAVLYRCRYRGTGIVWRTWSLFL